MPMMIGLSLLALAAAMWVVTTDRCLHVRRCNRCDGTRRITR